MTGRPSYAIERDVEADFPYLPAGCFIRLDRISQQIVLENIRRAIRTRRNEMANDLRGLGDVSLAEYLRETKRSLDDIYRGAEIGWASLRRQAGLSVPPRGPNETQLARALNRLRHIDDPERVGVYATWLRADRPPLLDSSRHRRLIEMLLTGLWGDKSSFTLDQAIAELWLHPAIRFELAELLELNSDNAETLPVEAGLGPDVPLLLHERYSRDEAFIGLGDSTFAKQSTSREGVRSLKDLRADCFFVTLDKSGTAFSPTTRYRDYPISPFEFHWESQSTTRISSPTGQRYLGRIDAGWRFLLFVRESPDLPTGRTTPFLFLGPARYVRHEGEQPIQVTWRLTRPMPAAFFEAARTAV